jgi:hypothetical protein
MRVHEDRGGQGTGGGQVREEIRSRSDRTRDPGRGQAGERRTGRGKRTGNRTRGRTKERDHTGGQEGERGRDRTPEDS